jgi:lysophospholipase L1-like esterase
MNWFIFHVVSGNSLFSGAAMVGIGMAMLSQHRWKRARMMGGAGVVVGTGFIWLSSTPGSAWAYLGLYGAEAFWIATEMWPRAGLGLKWVGRALTVAHIAVMVTAEIPHLGRVQMPSVRHETLYVLGDSLSAGIDERKLNWPSIFQRQTAARVVNLAKPGATLANVRKQADQVSDQPWLVFVEAGGNDLLGRTSPTEFRTDLDKLLSGLRKPSRTLVMFELPLLPGQVGFGRIQRSLARSYGVFLISKRDFARVLRRSNATTDGLHLSESGAVAMAELVKSIIGDAVVN